MQSPRRTLGATIAVLAILFFLVCGVWEFYGSLMPNFYSLWLPPAEAGDSHNSYLAGEHLKRVHRRLYAIYQSALPFRGLQLRRPLRRYPQNSFELPPPIDGVELVPRSALGFPCEDNPRVKELQTDCAIISRDFAGLGCDKRIIDVARDRGKDISLIPPMFRTVRVADVCPMTCGLCNLCAPGCAEWFVGNSYCEPQCNNTDCNFDGADCWDTDCVVGEWGEWSPCSITCDPGGVNGIGGVETRTRGVLHQKTLNGKPCPSLVEHRNGCNKGVACPVPCEVSGWGEWSACSTECGPGESTRSRIVVQPPANGASECPELVQTRPCFISECQKECETSEWSPWSSCSNVCGPGVQARKRVITNLPVGNITCPPLVEEKPCNGVLCPVLVTRVCAVSAWSEWTPCSAECNGGLQTRRRSYSLEDTEREKELSATQAACPPVDFIEEQLCNTFPCDADCVLSEWGAWSDCDVPCGMGYRMRTQYVVQEGVGIGVACPFPDGNVEKKPCYAGMCAQDCVVSEWSDWSECVTESNCGTGSVTRTREVLQYPTAEGRPCPSLVERSRCVKPCEQECALGPPTPWTPCDEGCQVIGRREEKRLLSFRWRSIDVWSRSCPEDELETESCSPFEDVCQNYSDADCLVSDWGPWTQCSASCGGGTRSRFRTEVQRPGPNGRACPVLVEEEPCGTAPCPMDCEVSGWEPWSSCSVECGIGIMTRSRSIIRPASVSPPGTCEALTETQACVGPLGDCEVAFGTGCRVSEWSAWSACSAKCGPYGTQYRTRRVLAAPALSVGEDCPELYEIKECNRVVCEEACQLSEWSEWSACTVDCGYPTDGVQVRYRRVLRQGSPGFPPCPDELKEKRPCLELKPCPVPCVLSAWLEWSPCSAACGIGEMYRMREVIQQPAFGGERCEHLKDVASCFIKPCVVDCQVGEWEPWTECSKECGGGTRKRKRDVVKTPLNGGIPCPTLVEYEECNTLSCFELMKSNPADCEVTEWSDWSPCPVECGGGVQHRTREIVHRGRPGGASCPSLIQRRGCGLGRCRNETGCHDRIDPDTGFPEKCISLKGLGCEKNLKELAEALEQPYPEDKPPEARVKDACPFTCGVCGECAPGCQERDKGNSVCDMECNNAECKFDLGDCGKDCRVPSRLPGLHISPQATGINVGERISVSCMDGSSRFLLAPEFHQVTIGCSKHTSTGLSQGAIPLSVPRERDGGQDEHLYVLKVDSDRLAAAFVPSRLPNSSKTGISSPESSGGDDTTMLTSLFQCVPDPCPFILVQGFFDQPPSTSTVMPAGPDGWIETLNGVYKRGLSDDGRFHYVQDKKQKSANDLVYHIWIDEVTAAVERPTRQLGRRDTFSVNDSVDLFQSRVFNESVKRDFSSRTSYGRNLRLLESNISVPFTWVIAPFSPYSDTGERVHETKSYFSDSLRSVASAIMVSTVGTCRLPPPGISPNLASCVGSPWEVELPATMLSSDQKQRVQIDNVNISCITSHERKALRQQRKPPHVSSSAATSPLNEYASTQPADRPGFPGVSNDVPVTYIKTDDSGEVRMVACEDRTEVKTFSGHQGCEELVKNLGCDFSLQAAGKPLPSFLPSDATIATVCPSSCDLCLPCAANCPVWFLGNGHCDFACNNAECEFDKGDCNQQESNRALVPGEVYSSSSSSDNCKTGVEYLVNEAGVQETCESLIWRALHQGLRLPDVCAISPQHLFSQFTPRSAAQRSLLRSAEELPLPKNDVHHDAVFENEVSGRTSFTPSQKERLSPAPKRRNAPIPGQQTIGQLCPIQCDALCTTTQRSIPSSLRSEVRPNTSPTLYNEHELTISSSTTAVPSSELNEDETACEDDPMVIRMGYSCPILKRVAERTLHKGCEVTLKELKAASNDTTPSEADNFPIIRLLDACPKTCNCCSCLRFRRPRRRKDGLWKVQITLSPSELPNCIHDTRFEAAANTSCFEIVDALRGNCTVSLKELTQGSLPPDVPSTLTLADTCGVACGKCRICEDSPIVEQVSGYSCREVAQTYGCDKNLAMIAPSLPNISAMAQLQHACPKTCGKCQRPHAYSLMVRDTMQPGFEASNQDSGGQFDDNNVCEDHPHIESIGVSCDRLYQFAKRNCQETLKSLGIDAAQLPPDLHPLSLISDVCPKFCGVCSEVARCADSPMIQKLNATCSLLIKVGNRGCNTLIGDLPKGRLATEHVFDDVVNKFRVKEVCRFSCGLCSEPSCSDGFQNGDEEGVDCGGVCRACRSCSPAPLKALGPAYSFRGHGLYHGANRTVQCQAGYSQEAGADPAVIYCDDGSFNKPSLVCSEPKIRVLRSTLRLYSVEPFDATILPPLYSAFEDVLKPHTRDSYPQQQESLRESSNWNIRRINDENGSSGNEKIVFSNQILPEDDIRFLTAGDCNELANVGTFVCEDNPAVQQHGDYDCSFLARLGCATTFGQLAKEYDAKLPPGVPGEATVADGCPKTCRSCDVAQKRSHLFRKEEVSNEIEPANSDGRHCLRVDIVVPENGLYAAALRRIFQKNLVHASSTLFTAALWRRLQRTAVFSSETSPSTAASQLSATLATPKPMPLPRSQWLTLYTINSDEALKDFGVAKSSLYTVLAARRVFIAPGLPSPVFDSNAIPRGLRPQMILGRMYRPTIGVGEGEVPFPITLQPATSEHSSSSMHNFNDKAGIVTGWYDASGSASVVSSIAVTVAERCRRTVSIGEPSDSTCCGLKQQFERFLAGPCGQRIYGRVVSEMDMNYFCFKRTESTTLDSSAKTGGSEGFHSEVYLSCYETALRLVDRHRNRGDVTCLILPFVEQLIHSWCTKDGVWDILSAPESLRETAKFCFPNIKATLQERFDLLYIASLSDKEMEDMCQPHSCTRYHLQYVDALAQLQLAWSFSASSIVTPVHRHRRFVASNNLPSSSQPSSFERSNDYPHSSATQPRERLLRFLDIPEAFFEDLENAQSLYSSMLNATLPAAHAAANVGFIGTVKPPFSRRRRRMLHTGYPGETFGSFVADFPELFLDFVCYKGKDSFCQQTLLLLTDQDPIHNPTALPDPCNIPCFVPMTGILGGLVEAFGERQRNPYYKALGSILRSYGRFYCTVNNKGEYCGTSLFAQMVRSNFVPYSPGKSAFSTATAVGNLPAGSSSLTQEMGSDSLEACPCSSSFINDGQCDAECFTASCFWDGDDCRVPNMFPEAFYALLNAFADRTTTVETRLSLQSNTSCLLFDPGFLCTNKCRELYLGGSHLEGCCFTAGLEALSSLLHIEMEHPNVKSTGRWVPDRSVALLEHLCQATLDRTCTGGKHRSILRLDVTFSNTQFYIPEANTPVDIEHPEMLIVAKYLRYTLAQTLQLVNSDITRIIFRRTPQGLVGEVFIDAGRDTPRVGDWLRETRQRQRLTEILQRRLTAIPLELRPRVLQGSPPPTVLLNTPMDHHLALSDFLLLTPTISFDNSPRVPYYGTLDFFPYERVLLNESCTTRDLWELGNGYRVYPSDAINVEHGATRTLRCFKKYYSPQGMPPTDTLVCNHGRWMKQNGLECRQRCWWENVWDALATGHQAVRREAYNISGLAASLASRAAGWVNHGLTQEIVCATGHTASRGRTVAVVTCNNGEWTPVILSCKRQCEPYRPPDPTEGYVIMEGDIRDVDHGTTLTVSCAPGFFPMPSLSDTMRITTRCDNGNWTPLIVACVKPGTVDPKTGPSMASHLARQLFTGVGMVGILVALALCILLIIAIATSWKLYFKKVAKQNAREHEENLDHASKLNAPPDIITATKPTYTQCTTLSCPYSSASMSSSLSLPREPASPPLTPSSLSVSQNGAGKAVTNATRQSSPASSIDSASNSELSHPRQFTRYDDADVQYALGSARPCSPYRHFRPLLRQNKTSDREWPDDVTDMSDALHQPAEPGGVTHHNTNQNTIPCDQRVGHSPYEMRCRRTTGVRREWHQRRARKRSNLDDGAEPSNASYPSSKQ